MKKFATFLIAVTIAVTAIAQIPTNGLVGYWPFNGNANDESGNSNNGIVNNATLTTDRFGNANNAYSFYNGQDITISNFNVNFTNISVSCWYKTSSPWDRVLHHNWNIPTGVFVILPGSSSTAAQFKDIAGNSPQVVSNGSNTCDNVWHNVVIIYSSLTSNAYLYIDGILKSTISTTSNLKNGIADLIFGGTMNTGTQISIDDICIYNRVLTQSEITTIYNDTPVECTQIISVTDTLIINANLTGFNPITYENTIKIYPNPTNDHIYINSNNNSIGSEIKIINTLSQIVYQTTINQILYYIDLNTWTGNGTYFVQLYDPIGNLLEVRKIILQ